MKDISITVIIPAYNEEKTIAKCLTSVLRQKVKADEIVVVNNNSTDKTVEIAKSFSVRVIDEKKQGMISARNAGFDYVKSDIIARTDADSMVPQNWIAKIKELFLQRDVLAVSGPAYFFDLPGTVKLSYLSSRLLFKLVEKRIKTDCLFGPNMALRKSAWEKVRKEVCTTDALVHEDIDLAIHLSKYGKIKFDSKLIIATSARRWKKPYSYLEYSYRLAKMLRKHKIKI